MNVFQPLLVVALCCVALGNGQGVPPSISFDNGIEDARCPPDDNPMNPILLAVQNDCRLFQKCSNGRAFTISCPPGQEFGVQIQRCDYPVFARCSQGFVQPQPAEFRYEAGSTDTRCPRFDDPLHPAHLAHPSDCRRFYKCFDGRAFELECPEGQEWGKELNRCDYPFMARCTARHQELETRDDVKIADGASAESEDKLESKEKKEEVTSRVEKNVRPAKAEFTYNTGINDVRCPQYDDPFRPIHLPHWSDCRKFQKCFDGRAYTISCPPGQEFGVRINRCDYPHFAQCSLPKSRKSLQKAAYDDNNYYDDDEPGNYLSLDSVEWTPEQREMVVGIPEKRCPGNDDPSEPIHFIHPRNCSKFYKCYSGRAYLFNCPVGQHWSVRWDRCDYPKVAKCTIRG